MSGLARTKGHGAEPVVTAEIVIDRHRWREAALEKPLSAEITVALRSGETALRESFHLPKCDSVLVAR